MRYFRFERNGMGYDGKAYEVVFYEVGTPILDNSRKGVGEHYHYSAYKIGMSYPIGTRVKVDDNLECIYNVKVESGSLLLKVTEIRKEEYKEEVAWCSPDTGNDNTYNTLSTPYRQPYEIDEDKLIHGTPIYSMNEFDKLKKAKEVNETAYITKTRETQETKTVFKINPNFWCIGGTLGGSNIGTQYCFYCVETSNANNSIRDCTGNLEGHEIHASNNAGVSAIILDQNQAESIKAGKINASQKQIPIEGRARAPICVVTLSTDNKGSLTVDFNIPNDNFYSLTHKRNMADSANQFSIQLFDKSAFEVEAYLMLGYRYISFHYQDSNAKTKYFKGQVMDFSTVMQGPHVMLTLEGYASFTSEDGLALSNLTQKSVPWKTICSFGLVGTSSTDANDSSIQAIRDYNKVYKPITNTNKYKIEIDTTDPNTWPVSWTYWTARDGYYIGPARFEKQEENNNPEHGGHSSGGGRNG